MAWRLLLITWIIAHIFNTIIHIKVLLKQLTVLLLPSSIHHKWYMDFFPFSPPAWLSETHYVCCREELWCSWAIRLPQCERKKTDRAKLLQAIMEDTCQCSWRVHTVLSLKIGTKYNEKKEKGMRQIPPKEGGGYHSITSHSNPLH